MVVEDVNVFIAGHENVVGLCMLRTRPVEIQERKVVFEKKLMFNVMLKWFRSWRKWESGHRNT